MDLWGFWVDALERGVHALSANFGLSEAMAIIVFTLLTRVLIAPVSLAVSYRGQKTRDALERIKPELEDLRARFADNPRELSERTLALYRRHGVKLFDRWSFFNLIGQTSLGLGTFRALGHLSFGSRFLWIANLARPDVWLTALVGVLMLAAIALMPGLSPDAPKYLFYLPVIASVVAVAALPSAIGLYWATTNAVSIAQNLLLRAWLNRERRLA